MINKADYVSNVNKMIHERIVSGKYIGTSDTTHADLKHIQGFLYRHLRIKNVLMKCTLFQINWTNSLLQLRYINSSH